jgi:hypothetical protein
MWRFERLRGKPSPSACLLSNIGTIEPTMDEIRKDLLQASIAPDPQRIGGNYGSLSAYLPKMIHHHLATHHPD